MADPRRAGLYHWHGSRAAGRDLKVAGETAEYWDTPGGRIATVLSFAKAKITGERYSGGENETVNL